MSETLEELREKVKAQQGMKPCRGDQLVFLPSQKLTDSEGPCTYCKGNGEERASFPVVITDIQWPNLDEMLAMRSFGSGKIGDFVAVRPVDEEKSFLGIHLGDFASGLTSGIGGDGKLALDWRMGNPAIYIPDLKRIVRGYGSWWGVIKDEKHLREITDDDINNVWYVQAMKAMTKKVTT